MQVNGFDMDGVISIGIYPGPNDVIITGRSYEEKPETESYLKLRGITNSIFYNNVEFKNKTRKSSGEHKAERIKLLRDAGIVINIFFEDDPIQKEVIERECPWVEIVHIVHELTEKENVRHINE